jgi:hypothetical protein
MRPENVRVDMVVTNTTLQRSPVYRVIEILDDNRRFELRRIYGNEITTPFIAEIKNYRRATKEQCRNAGLVT